MTFTFSKLTKELKSQKNLILNLNKDRKNEEY